MNAKEFDGDGFYRAIESSVKARGTNWKSVSQATGVSQTTLTRMGQGRRPDAASMAALSAWADINPARFVSGVAPMGARSIGSEINTVSLIRQTLRDDASLSDDARKRLTTIFETAYEALKTTGAKDPSEQ